MSLGYNSKELLDKELRDYIKEKGDNNDKFIGVNPIEFCEWLFSRSEYLNLVNYSQIAKHYHKLFLLTAGIYALICFAIIKVLDYFIEYKPLYYGISSILGVLLLFVIYFNSSESYDKYYSKTMRNLLESAYNKLSYGFYKSGVDKAEIKKNIVKQFTSKTTQNGIKFNNSVINGKILDIKLKNTEQVKNRQTGTETNKTTTVFDGFYMQVSVNNSFNKLKGNTIKITEDENFISHVSEDTVKGIYESDLEFNFNSEELNKSLDCKVSGHKGFVDADGILMEVNKIITPSFEQHLLYLRKRYNSFNMNIMDDGFNISIDMRRDLFKQIKHGELLDFIKTYREVSDSFLLKSRLFGMDDFAYYIIFPYVEKLYLVNYLSYLYLSSMNFDNYFSLNNDVINSFETGMENIYGMDNREFKKIKNDFILNVKNDFSKNLSKFKKGVI